MAGTKQALGRGLEDLISPTAPLEHLAPPQPSPASPESAPAARWEYLTLSRSRRGKKRLTLLISNPGRSVKPRRIPLPGTPRWTAVGILGANGWELFAVTNRTQYFRRPLP